MKKLAALFAAYKAADNKACDATDGSGRTPRANKAAVTRAFRKLVAEISKQHPGKETVCVVQNLNDEYIANDANKFAMLNTGKD